LFFDDFPQFGRLDLPSMYVLGAASLLPGVPAAISRETGVFLGSEHGCLDADVKFAASMSRRPAPRLFVRTLPSTPAAETAVRFGLMGPNECFVHDHGAEWTAIAAAVQSVESGSCCAAIAGGYEAVGPDVGDQGGLWSALVLLGPSPLPGCDCRRLELSRVETGSDGHEGAEGGNFRAWCDAVLDLDRSKGMLRYCEFGGVRMRVDTSPVCGGGR